MIPVVGKSMTDTCAWSVFLLKLS